MILDQITKATGPQLGHIQYGSLKKRSVVVQVLALQRCNKKVRKNDLPAIIIFIDFKKKTFDFILGNK